MINRNKYMNAIITAYKRNEMEMLFGCKPFYAIDENGKYYLQRDIRLTGVASENEDPIDLEALLSATEQYYCSLDRKRGEKEQFINKFVNMLLKLIKSNSVCDLYFATEIYYILAERERKDIFYPLEGVYKRVKKNIEIKVSERKEELKMKKIYAGMTQENGLWDILKVRNAKADEKVKLAGVKWDG